MKRFSVRYLRKLGLQNTTITCLFLVCQQMCYNSYLFNEFVCKLVFFWYEWARLKRECNERFKGLRVPKKSNLHKNELNTTFVCSITPIKAQNRLKSLKLT
jgi:hypothetical protein